MTASEYLLQNHKYVTQISEKEFEYVDSSIAAISCEHEGDTITMPPNHQKYDWLFIVKSIDNSLKREMFFVKVDDVIEYLRPSVIGSYPFIGKRSISTLRRNNKVYDSLLSVVKAKPIIKQRSAAYSIF